MIHIGTSGWSYREWVGGLYPRGTAPGDFLKTYAEHFDTVEINNSFYRMPVPSMLKAWVDKTPPSFLFSVKAWRAIVHANTANPAHISDFFSAIDVLGDKLGPVLLQFPPSRKVNVAWLEQLLAALPKNYQYVFELRDRTWLCDPVYDVLRKHNAANCFYDFKGFANPEVSTTDFVYIRLHGPLKQPYKGGYSMERMHHYATLLKKHKNAYIYFDNTMEGHAVYDARTVQALCRDKN